MPLVTPVFLALSLLPFGGLSLDNIAAPRAGIPATPAQAIDRLLSRLPWSAFRLTSLSILSRSRLLLSLFHQPHLLSTRPQLLTGTFVHSLLFISLFFLKNPQRCFLPAAHLPAHHGPYRQLHTVDLGPILDVHRDR